MKHDFKQSLIFEKFKELQDRGVKIIFGFTGSFDEKHGEYKTYAAATIPNKITREAIDDGLTRESDVDKICHETAEKILGEWAKSIVTEQPMVLRILPEYQIEEDNIRFTKTVIFRVRMINEGCTFPVKPEGRPVVFMDWENE